MSQDTKASQLRVIGALTLSVASSVTIVICDKYLISTLGFIFATTLTSWHLLVTFLTLHVAYWFNLFEAKPIDLQTVVLFGILNGTSIGLQNLCLAFNSIGFYQMTKLAMIPFTVLLETVFLAKKFSMNVKVSLLILLFGVGMASVTDLQLNLLGSIISILAIAATCTSQILINQIQRRLMVSPTQLLYRSVPYQAAVLVMMGPFIDRILTSRDVFRYHYSVEVLFFILLSCLIAVSVNFSLFLVIGTTSPVTYQVLGHLKTCLILTFGYLLLKNPFTWKNIIGILIAVSGMVFYSYFSVHDAREKTQKEALPNANQEMLERDSGLLMCSVATVMDGDAEGEEVANGAAKTVYSSR